MNFVEYKGFGPQTIKTLKELNINDINDLLTYYPYRYNYYHLETLKESEEEITVKGIIVSTPYINYIKKNFNQIIFQANINNNLIKVVIFNRAFMKKNLTVNKEIILVGRYNKQKNTFTASNIKLTPFENDFIEPVYHLGGNLNSKKLNTLIKNILETNPLVEDYIPTYLNTKYKFTDKLSCLKLIHNPTSIEDIKKAKVKLIYEELFAFMLKINYLKQEHKKANTNFNRQEFNKEINDFILSLPFSLTNDQLNAIKEIDQDLISNNRMNRLLLGDVGSGKTIVAVIAIYLNYLNGFQSSLMVPTEVLAEQHLKNITDLLKKTNLSVEILTSSTLKKEKQKILERLNNGEIDLLIGTHSILNENVKFKNLGLVITDEQHRFGVNQREVFQNKGIKPDTLYMSATPIPRTYALTLYGDMDISIIKEKPKNRKEIITKVYKNEDIKIVLTKMLEEIKLGNKIFVVAPLIEESEKIDLTNVLKLKESFDIAFQNKVKTNILHGKLKSSEKEDIMDDFVNGKTSILISTTVIEVGIDVQKATMIIIFDANRFGLATLHQLRGRVGRNDQNSYCFLIGNKDNKRLSVMEESNDGFYISEKDYEMRKEGDIFGVRQSGDMSFKIANLKTDYKILLQAQKDSEEFLNSKDISITKIQKIINELTIID